MKSKRLYIRLSSLGDVVIASCALEVNTSRHIDELYWLVLNDYASLLENHPKLNGVLTFDRKTGFLGWRALCRSIWESEYSEIFDLHCTLRTRLMKLWFFWWSIIERKRMPLWKTISKQRFRLYGYYIFKKFWPSCFRPDSWVKRYSQFVGGSGGERPNLKHLLSSLNSHLVHDLKSQKYICVMPSSRWAGKVWPVEYFYELIERHFSEFTPVVLGAHSDVQSARLVEMLKARGISCVSGVGQWNLVETASVLAHSVGIVGVDTGLVHLAESLGVPVISIFGPTTPSMGFGPWREQSRVLGLDLLCRPCGKDGRFCYRVFQPYQCLRGYTPEMAVHDLDSGLISGKLSRE